MSPFSSNSVNMPVLASLCFGLYLYTDLCTFPNFFLLGRNPLGMAEESLSHLKVLSTLVTKNTFLKIKIVQMLVLKELLRTQGFILKIPRNMFRHSK